MCGILGAFQSIPDLQATGRLKAAMAELKHRGPDDSDLTNLPVAGGLLSLGHARLSIIDLSSAGRQPMQTSDGRYTIVFNGEIYNYRELRAELTARGCRFISDSDTEVLLAAWAVWGRDCLPRLVGMFAFAIFDRDALTLTCVRDPFGVKPFFFAREGADFFFASELPALLKLKQSKPQLNWGRSYDYLVHGDYDSLDQTFVDGVFHLPPAHLQIIDLTRPAHGAVHRWWAPRIQERQDITFAQATEEVRDRFLQSIRLHLRSDVPLGAALSGGIDSSAVVCAMRHVAPDSPIHTFTYAAAGSDVNEEHWADMVNSHVGAIAHKVVVTPDELARDLDDMIRTQGEPFGSTSIYAQYRVYQLAKDSGITVTLDGQGADELLAGYDGYPGLRLRSLIETKQWGRAWNFLERWSQWPGRSRSMALKLLASEMTSGTLHHVLRRASGRQSVPGWIRHEMLLERGVGLRHPRQRPSISHEGRRVMAELAHALSRRGLVGLLRHGDRNSMRFSVESRVPFLTLDQVEYALSLPESYLISDEGETKSVFRAAMRGIVPDAILDRKDKIGFQTPERQWLTSMSGVVRQWLSEDASVPFLDQGKVLQSFDEIIAGQRPFSWQVWRWVNFIRWHQRFLS